MNELSLFNSLFDNVMGTNPSIYYAGASSPRVDVLENKDSYTFEMELPGRSENDVTIELDKDTLKIASVEDKKENKDKKDQTYLIRERRTSAFERSFKLPQDIDSESITATFKNGILTINMLKKAVEAPKKILIEAC